MLAVDEYTEQSEFAFGNCAECGNLFTGHLNHIDPLVASLCFGCAGEIIESIADAECWDCALREVECQC